MIISFPYKATPKVEREKITAILYKREMENVIGFPTYTERRVIPFESQQKEKMLYVHNPIITTILQQPTRFREWFGKSTPLHTKYLGRSGIGYI